MQVTLHQLVLFEGEIIVIQPLNHLNRTSN